MPALDDASARRHRVLAGPARRPRGQQFAAALAEHDLTPPLAGIMRLLRAQPGLSQQQLAEILGTAPSRVVSYVDELESRGWVERTRDAVDRRVNVITLTAAGREAFTSIAMVGREHERRITAGLDERRAGRAAGPADQGRGPPAADARRAPGLPIRLTRKRAVS